jgi:hypothetical protein
MEMITSIKGTSRVNCKDEFLVFIVNIKTDGHKYPAQSQIHESHCQIHK